METDSFDSFFYKPKSIYEIKETALIVVDTNVLLSAYQWREVTLKEVIKTLESISLEDRLRIPSHVIKEFFDQRPKRITDIIKKIDNEINSKIQRPPKLFSVVPLLEMLEEVDEYKKIEDEFFEIYESYRKKIPTLTKRISNLYNNDPVLDAIEKLLRKSSFELDSITVKTLDEEAKLRAQQRKPPLTGGDGSKNENKFGDFYIWKHILSLKNDVIFVTSDNKDDWVIKDHHGKFLAPRRELIEEYFQTNGNTFTIVSPKQLVELYKPEIDDQIKADLNESDNLANKSSQDYSLFFFIRNVVNHEDPVGVYSLTGLEDEYQSVSRAIMGIIHKTNSLDDFTREIAKIFIADFGEKYAGTMESHRAIAEELWNYREFF